MLFKPNQGINKWGRPKTIDDITKIFLAYLESRLDTTPWSVAPLSPETLPILPHLIEINSRCWWTVASQPAVDSVPSEDDVYGWGPRGGYVFQKAFVEFFATKEEVLKLETKVKTKGDSWITFFAANMLVSTRRFSFSL